MATNNHKWWEPGVEFAGHIVIASVIFIIIALVAVALYFTVGWLEGTGIPACPGLAVPWWIVTTLKVLEILLFIVDVVTYTAYVGNSAVKFILSIFRR